MQLDKMLVPPEKSKEAEANDEYDSQPQYYGSQAGSSRNAELPPSYDDTTYLRSPPQQQGPDGPRSPGFLERMRSNGAAKPSDLLNPPPPSFKRPPRVDLSYEPFPQCALQSLESQLDKGWPLLPPQSLAQRHPFATHDVQEEDWTRFVTDMKRVGMLSPMNHIVANVAPMAMGLGLAGECRHVV